jgi:hypothetical protein
VAEKLPVLFLARIFMEKEIPIVEELNGLSAGRTLFGV